MSAGALTDEVMVKAGHRLASAPSTSGEDPPASIDKTDLTILTQLLRDGRRPVRRIAADLGLSAPAVAERIARLEHKRVLLGYHAEVDWGRLGYGITLYVAVTGAQGWEQSQALAALRAIPEVETVEVVTGALDLLVKLRVRDHRHLQECLFERIWKVPGVHRTETMVCLGDLPPKNFGLELAQALADEDATGSAGERSSGRSAGSEVASRV